MLPGAVPLSQPQEGRCSPPAGGDPLPVLTPEHGDRTGSRGCDLGWPWPVPPSPRESHTKPWRPIKLLQLELLDKLKVPRSPKGKRMLTPRDALPMLCVKISGTRR